MLKLRSHAQIVSISLLALAVLLGVRAYSVAYSHYDSIRRLVNYDLRAQSVLVRMESIVASRDQALGKYKITHDDSYSALAEYQGEKLAIATDELTRALISAYPDREPGTLKLETAEQIQTLHHALNERREAKLHGAHDAALGLLRTILWALGLSAAVTGWVLYLFFKGFMDPLDSLKDATTRIKQGELSYRIPRPRTAASWLGVRELGELSQSFNSMAEKLEHLDHAKTEFLQMVSHEFKNPLAALKEGIHLLASHEGTMSPLARSRGFAACSIATKRLESMINNLLSHSRSAHAIGLYQFDLVPKNLSPAIQTAIDEVRLLAEKRQMAIRFSAADDLPAAFNWDGMVHVFENLLLNAIKYGPENSTIDVQADTIEPPEGEALPNIQITVSNEGPGIPETERHRIFEMFFRGSNAKTQQGLGMGLHVVKRIIDAHHGAVSANSHDGRTQIRVQIPCRYETEALA